MSKSNLHGHIVAKKSSIQKVTLLDHYVICIICCEMHQNSLSLIACFLYFQDLDIVKFIINALSSNFPSLLAYILLFEMPFILQGKFIVLF